MDKVQQYLQDEIDGTLDTIAVLSSHAIKAIDAVVNNIGNLSEEEQRDYVLIMDDHVKQVEVILSLMKRANITMRMKNRYDDENFI
jgi:polyhydroxyalkanoate synthesis regulator phasin